MAGDEVKVKMKVSLDAASIAEAQAKAEADLEKDLSDSASAGKKEKEKAKFKEELGDTIKRGLSGLFESLPGGRAAVAGGGAAAGIAGGIAGGLTAVAVLEALRLLGKIVMALKQLAVNLARFNPLIFGTLRRFQITMRGLGIQLSRIMEPLLKNVISVLGDLTVLLVTILKPSLLILSNATRQLALVLGGLAKLLTWIMGLINKVIGMILEAIADMIAKVADIIPGSVGDKLHEVAGELRRAAQSMQRTDPMDQATEMNRAFLEGLRNQAEYDRQDTEERKGHFFPGEGVEAAEREENDMPVVARPQSYTRPSPAPRTMDFKQDVNFDVNIKMAHEEAVQRAIEQIRTKLWQSVNVVRNETLQLGNIMNARNVVDAVGKI